LVFSVTTRFNQFILLRYQIHILSSLKNNRIVNESSLIETFLYTVVSYSQCWVCGPVVHERSANVLLSTTNYNTHLLIFLCIRIIFTIFESKACFLHAKSWQLHFFGHKSWPGKWRGSCLQTLSLYICAHQLWLRTEITFM
jgi:hypothetical protein